MPNWMKILLVFVGTVIGAGFASGQEIMQFFVLYGEKSVWGLLVSGLLFGLIAACVLCKIYIKDVKTVDEYFGDIAGKRVTIALNIIITLFMLSSFCVMVAGSGAVFCEYLNMPMWLGILIMCLLCGYIFFRDVKGIVELNAFVTPIMIIGILTLGIYIYITNEVAEVFAGGVVVHNWITSCIIYVSYNTLTIVAVMTALHKMIDAKSVALKAAAGSGGILFVMAAILWWVLITFDTGGAQLPMLHAIGGVSSVARAVYIPILYIAMLTTAVSSGFGVIWSVKSMLAINERVTSVLICVLGGIVGFSGFSQLVEKLYSLFGIIGIGAMLLIIIDGIKYLHCEKKREFK